MTETPVPVAPQRADPPALQDERASLEAWLEFHRATLLRKCAGLDGAQLARRACPPSDLSLLGLVRHMTDTERGWFLRRWRDDFERRYPDGADIGDVDPGRAPQDVAAYLAALDECRAEARLHDLDERVPRRPEQADGQLIDVRWIHLHMIEEYARHNGHADLLRQAVDGATGA